MPKDHSQSLFQATLRSVCGPAALDLDPREVIYAADPVSQIAEVCGRAVPGQGRRVTVLADGRTRSVAGDAAADILRRAGWQVDLIIVPDPPGGTPVCDDRTRDALAVRLLEPQLILAVGSGVINDLGKWLAAECAIPYVALATAASMTGYASANVAPAVRGVKTLVRGRPPAAILSTPAILRSAPYEMTAAGLGDAVAKIVSSTDWRLNNFLFGDEYLPDVVGLAAAVEPLYLDRPEALRALEPSALEALFAALNLIGVSQTMARTSAPASGGEHLISHALDMISSLDGRPHDLHGRQVGVGTILAAELYSRALAIESPHFVAAPERIDEPFWGRLAGAVAVCYAEKQARLRQGPRSPLSRRRLGPPAADPGSDAPPAAGRSRLPGPGRRRHHGGGHPLRPRASPVGLPPCPRNPAPLHHHRPRPPPRLPAARRRRNRSLENFADCRFPETFLIPARLSRY
jgi:glycerol dehydrogenase-like iron-containing ADH family enzyme